MDTVANIILIIVIAVWVNQAISVLKLTIAVYANAQHKLDKTIYNTLMNLCVAVISATILVLSVPLIVAIKIILLYYENNNIRIGSDAFLNTPEGSIKVKIIKKYKKYAVVEWVNYSLDNNILSVETSEVSIDRLSISPVKL